MEVWLRVGEVARRTGLTVRTLHHYDERGLLVPSGRSHSDYRLYSPEDLRRLLQIQQLKSLGLSLDEVGEALDSDDFDAGGTLERLIDAVEERIEAETELLRRLHRLRGAAGIGWEEVASTVALTERLRHPEPQVRFRAALDSPAAAPVDELVERLRSEPEPGIREVLTWALVHHGDTALDAVLPELGHPDPFVRRQFAHVLSKLRQPAGVPALVPLLADPHPEVAAKAAQALGMIGGDEALEALVAALRAGQGDPAVVDALALMGPAAVGPLVRALGDPRAPVRARAAEALALIGDDRSAEGLVNALSDADADVRYEALLALGQLEGDMATGAVESLIDSDDARLAAVARRLRRG